MAKLTWDAVGKKFYETGTDRGVLFVMKDDGTYDNGVAWDGLTAVKEAPDGAEETALYANNKKYVPLTSAENFKGSIEAYTYPDEFNECDGAAELASGITIGQQGRKVFGLAYRTLVGNDVKGNDYGEKIHIVYGAKVAPSAREYATVNESPEAITLSWEFNTTPVEVDGYKPFAKITVDSRKVSAAKLKEIQDLLWGTEALESSLPSPEALIALLTAEAGTAEAGTGEQE